jgi:hypothetical protein
MSNWVDLTSDEHWDIFRDGGSAEWDGTKWVGVEATTVWLYPTEDGFFALPVAIEGIRVTGTSTSDNWEGPPATDAVVVLDIDGEQYGFDADLTEGSTTVELLISVTLDRENALFALEFTPKSAWWEYPMVEITKVEVLIDSGLGPSAFWTNRVHTREICE